MLRCKAEKLTPTFLNINVNHVKFTNVVSLRRNFKNSVLSQFKFKTLILLITNTTLIINKYEKDLNLIKNKIKGFLPENIFNNFLNTTKIQSEVVFKKTKQRHLKKIDKLIRKQNKSNQNYGKLWVENLTNKEISDYVFDVLSLGPNFSVPIEKTNNIPIPEIICNIESPISMANNSIKDEIRTKICNILTNFKNKKIQKLKTNFYTQK